MAKPADDKNKQGQGQQAGAAATPPASGGNTPPAPEGNAGSAATPQGGAQGSTPPAPPATGDNQPPAPPTESGGKKRVKCEALKGKKIIIGKGETVQIDENGFFEVDAKEAERLLSIPGYKEA